MGYIHLIIFCQEKEVEYSPQTMEVSVFCKGKRVLKSTLNYVSRSPLGGNL